MGTAGSADRPSEVSRSTTAGHRTAPKRDEMSGRPTAPPEIGGRVTPLIGVCRANHLRHRCSQNAGKSPRPTTCGRDGGGSVSDGPRISTISAIRGTAMHLSRRDMFKIGGLGALGAAGLAIPFGNTVSGSSASLLSSSKMPKPYQATFGRLEVLSPVVAGWTTRARSDYYDITAKAGRGAGIVPGMLTPGARLRRRGAGAADRRRAGHPHRDDDAQQAPRRASHLRHPDADLHPPARVGVAAAVRRLRQRHHLARAEEVLPLPELPAGPHALVPRPRRALHRAERLLRAWPRSTTCTTPMERALLPQGEFDVAITLSDMMFAGQRVPAVRRPHALRAVGRRHPGQRPALAGDEGEEADLPVPVPQRLAVPVLPADAVTGGADVHGRHRRRADAEVPARSPSGGTAAPNGTRC